MRNGLLAVIAFSTLFLVSLVIVYGASYFAASPLAIARSIVVNGKIPQRIYDVSGFWNDHANTFINYPGSALLISALSIVMDVDYYAFARLPLVAIPWVLVLFCVTKLFVKENKCLCVLVTFALTVLTLSIYPHSWTINYHSLSYLSHLFTLFLSTKLILEGDRSRSRRISMMLLLFYTISLLNYYATSMFSIVLLLGLVSWATILRGVNYVGFTTRLPLLFFVAYITYDVMFWNVISYWKLDVAGLFETITASVSRFLSGLPASEKLFRYGYPFELTLLDKWLKYIYLSFIGPYAILTLALIYLAPILPGEKKKLAILVLSSLSVAAFESIPYAIVTGGINVRYLSFFVPIMTMSITGMLLSHQRLTNIKKVIFCVLLIYLMIVAVSSIKLNYINNAVSGLGVNKKELVQWPEYTTLASYAPPQTLIYSNFQISGELRLSSIKVGTDRYVLCSPFEEAIYDFFEAIEKRSLEKLRKSLGERSIIVLAYSDFSKPMYGDVWGYAVRPLGEQAKKWLENTALDLAYDSGRLKTFYIK